MFLVFVEKLCVKCGQDTKNTKTAAVSRKSLATVLPVTVATNLISNKGQTCSGRHLVHSNSHKDIRNQRHRSWTTWVRFPAGAGILSLGHGIQTGCGAHPAPYIRSSFSRDEVTGVKLTTHLHLNTEALCLVKHRYNVTGRGERLASHAPAVLSLGNSLRYPLHGSLHAPAAHRTLVVQPVGSSYMSYVIISRR
jgi:hypothetical protein